MYKLDMRSIEHECPYSKANESEQVRAPTYTLSTLPALSSGTHCLRMSSILIRWSHSGPGSVQGSEVKTCNRYGFGYNE